MEIATNEAGGFGSRAARPAERTGAAAHWARDAPRLHSPV